MYQLYVQLNAIILPKLPKAENVMSIKLILKNAQVGYNNASGVDNHQINKKNPSLTHHTKHTTIMTNNFFSN